VQRSSKIPRVTANDFNEAYACLQLMAFRIGLNPKFSGQKPPPQPISAANKIT